MLSKDTQETRDGLASRFHRGDGLHRLARVIDRRSCPVKNRAESFLEAWLDCLTAVGQSGVGLDYLLLSDAKEAGFSEDEMRAAANGNVAAYLAEHGVQVERR